MTEGQKCEADIFSTFFYFKTPVSCAALCWLPVCQLITVFKNIKHQFEWATKKHYGLRFSSNSRLIFASYLNIRSGPSGPVQIKSNLHLWGVYVYHNVLLPMLLQVFTLVFLFFLLPDDDLLILATSSICWLLVPWKGLLSHGAAFSSPLFSTSCCLRHSFSNPSQGALIYPWMHLFSFWIVEHILILAQGGNPPCTVGSFRVFKSVASYKSSLVSDNW